jgi:hypothetical protein
VSILQFTDGSIILLNCHTDEDTTLEEGVGLTLIEGVTVVVTDGVGVGVGVIQSSAK